MFFESGQTVWDIPIKLRLHDFFDFKNPPQNVDLYLCFPYVKRSALQNGKDASSGLHDRFVLQNTYANNKTNASPTRNAWFRSLIRQWPLQKRCIVEQLTFEIVFSFFLGCVVEECVFGNNQTPHTKPSFPVDKSNVWPPTFFN